MKQIIVIFVVVLFLHGQVQPKSLSTELSSPHKKHHHRHQRHHNALLSNHQAQDQRTILGQPVKSEHILMRHEDQPEQQQHQQQQQQKHQRQHHNNNHRTSEHDDRLHEKTTSANCSKCRQRDGIQMTEEQLTELRLEYVKNEILKRLKLKERPKKVSSADLPLPIAEGATIHMDEEDENALTGIPDDYYGKTTQKIIFPQFGEQN